MNDDLEKIFVDMYKQAKEHLASLNQEVAKANARISQLKYILERMNLEFDTDTIIIERRNK